MSATSMPKTSTNYANLTILEKLNEAIDNRGTRQLSKFLLEAKKKNNPNINVEFELRLGKYEKGRDRHYFNPGVSYEEFSRFYTYLGENDEYKKVSSENYLDIYCEAIHTRDKKPIRMTISGAGAIMNYCATNLIPETVTFQTKDRLTEHLDIDNLDVRISMSEEKTLPLHTMMIGTMDGVNKEASLANKQFRYKQRISYLSSNEMFRYDITQTKQVYSGSDLKLERNLADSQLFNQQPVYEVEVEFNNDYLKTTEFPVNFTEILLQEITNIMQIRNNTELVLTNGDKEYVLKDFLKLYTRGEEDVNRLFDEYYNRRDKQYHKMFPGAKVSTLEIDNLFKGDPQKKKPYIFNDYTVTDKADGERYLLFIDSRNFVFFINDRMEVLRTDIQVPESENIKQTILDGELVVTVEKGVQVYNYYGFDIIFRNNEAVYKRVLFPSGTLERSEFRIGILENVVNIIKKLPVPTIDGVPFVQVNMKNFRSIDGENQAQMLQHCAAIWNHREGFKYTLDGLIFTPKFEEYPIGKLWASALKWKPPKENSIDFLVKFRSGDNGNQTIVDGDEITKYQLADLYVGDIVDRKGFKEYVEKKFDIPNTISKEPTYLIRIPVHSTGSKDDVIVRDETIIECVWNNGWKVLRTRLDKTQRYLASNKKISGTANNIGVAISIWSTIVYPITVNMITGVDPIQPSKKSEYYSNVGSSLTDPVRSFNNYMKAVLISGARKSGSSLIDFSCGRCGDLQKWFVSNYNRVVGLDYSRTGIESLDPEIGAFGRIETKKRTNPKFAKWVESVDLFWADTSKLITTSYQNGICNTSQKSAAKKALELPFDVGVSFFTAHYYFESPMKIRGFFQNMFDNVSNGGLAIITCFDGQEIFKWLENLETGQVYSGLVDSKPVWQIKKGYNKHTPFLDNSYNVGLKIDIKFESISDDYLTEYLVHPNYLLKIAEEYGFTPISVSEANSQFGLPSGTGLFGDIMKDLDNSTEMKKLKSSELGKIYYDDINKLVSDDKYTDLREWNKHNRYYILRKNSADNTVTKTWRSKLSKYDCQTDYEPAEVSIEIDLSEPPVQSTVPVKTIELVDHVESPAPVIAPKKTLSRKKSANVQEVPAEEEAPKKRILKLKKKEAEQVPVVEQVEQQEVAAEVPVVEVVPKKRTIKKKPVSEEVPAEVPAEVALEVAVEPKNASKPANAANNQQVKPSVPRKKKTLVAGPNVLAMLQKAVAEPSSAEEQVQPVVAAETQSELESVVQKVAVGTKIKIPKKLLKK